MARACQRVTIAERDYAERSGIRNCIGGAVIELMMNLELSISN
jgi:hypothetical protein